MRHQIWCFKIAVWNLSQNRFGITASIVVACSDPWFNKLSEFFVLKSKVMHFVRQLSTSIQRVLVPIAARNKDHPKWQRVQGKHHR